MPNPTFTLYNGKYKIPITVLEGVSALRELSQSSNSIFAAGGGPGRYGDYEPLYATNEQRTWEGGRGLEFFVDDPSRYFDSNRAWSLTPGRIGPSPQWKYGVGYRPNLAEFSLPGNATFKPLYGDTQYISRSYTPAANITADKAYFWVRRVGTPAGNLTVEIHADSSGEPSGTALKSKTISTSDITDYESVFQVFDWTGTEALTGSTLYHFVVYGDDDDDRDGHWEIATDVTTSNSLESEDGSTWNSAAYSLYFRITGADIPAHHKFFRLDGVLYAVSIYDTATSSRLWMNGARGKATAGASTTLTNSNASFGTSSEYVGALVKITQGAGKGQVRTIASHTGTVLTVSEAWDINPGSDSQYIVYQTPRWTEITSTGLGQVESLCVYASAGQIAVFGHKGTSDPIRKIRFNPGASPPAHEFADDGTNEANIVRVAHIAGTGPVLVRAVNGDGVANVSFDGVVNWGTGHTFGTAIVAGNPRMPVTNMLEQAEGTNSRLFVLKPDEIGFIDLDNSKYYKINVALDSFPEATNGAAALVHGLYLYFNWSWSMERLYGTAIDDLDPNREAGIPQTRQGYVSAMTTHPVGILFAIDAGDDGYSSVMFFDGVGFHEVFRAPIAGQRIRDLIWQPNEGGKKYLWISCGDDLIYVPFPRFHRDPYRDSEQEFMHEFSVTTAVFDMGNSAIEKVWKDLAVVCRNFDGIGVKAKLDYQSDDDIDSGEWTQIDVGELRSSPRSVAQLFIGESTSIRFRIRAQSTIATTPPIITGLVVKGAGFLPDTPMITFQGQFGSVYETLGGSKASTLEMFRNNPALIWTIVDSDFKAAEGRKVAVRVVQNQPQFTLNEEDNVTAQIQLMGLDR